MKINTEEILDSIKTCDNLINIFYNGNSPSRSFMPKLRLVRDTLRKLITIDTSVVCNCNISDSNKN